MFELGESGQRLDRLVGESQIGRILQEPDLQDQVEVGFTREQLADLVACIGVSQAQLKREVVEAVRRVFAARELTRPSYPSKVELGASEGPRREGMSFAGIGAALEQLVGSNQFTEYLLEAELEEDGVIRFNREDFAELVETIEETDNLLRDQLIDEVQDIFGVDRRPLTAPFSPSEINGLKDAQLRWMVANAQNAPHRGEKPREL